MSTCTTTLPHTTLGVREARNRVAHLLSGRCNLATLETAALLTSELATNAILHAAPPVHLRAEITDVLVRVEMHDGGSRTLPAPRTARTIDRGGRGLAIVDDLASRWGTERTDAGSFVWFELSPRQ